MPKIITPGYQALIEQVVTLLVKRLNECEFVFKGKRYHLISLDLAQRIKEECEKLMREVELTCSELHMLDQYSPNQDYTLLVLPRIAN